MFSISGKKEHNCSEWITDYNVLINNVSNNYVFRFCTTVTFQHISTFINISADLKVFVRQKFK